MAFRPRNAYYLRISNQIHDERIDQLYLDERHIDWMSDIVLQHVLADLRPLIIPKLQAEKDIHFGPGVTPGNKRGTVEVHRGETYQFAYFFRKTEPHSVVFKSRHFVTAPVCPAKVVPKPASPLLADRNPQKKRSRNQVSAKQSKRKRSKAEGKGEISTSHLDEETEDDLDDTDPIPREPRPVRKQRRIIANTYQEDDEDDAEDLYQDVAMNSPSSEAEGGSSGVPCGPQAVIGEDVVANHQASLSADTPDIELVVEEEEKKPKPLLKLKYQSFPISGRCLCVVVEPWPSLRTETGLQSIGFGTSLRPGGLEPSLASDGSAMRRQRAKTPLFFPENDRAPSEAPSARERTLPPVPLFQETIEDDYSDDDLMNFSQTLNAAGHMHAITADDDDDMEGAILFGDADEVRELF